MRNRTIVLGIATGFGVGYCLIRAMESFQAMRCAQPRREHDAARYGATRRALGTAAIARSLTWSYALACGPVGARLERSVEALPVWLRPSAFAAQATLLEALVDLPASFAEGHALERRYGLSEQSPQSWLADATKELMLGTIVSAGLAGLFAAALRRFPNTWPWVASAATLPLLLLANIVVPIYVLPLFNTYEPIEGPLEERLRALAARYGAGDAEILRVDMSKQTKKANAFVIGIGNTRRIVVGDTLIEHFPEDEIAFVVAHELGHYVAKDSWRMIAVGQIAAMAMMFALRQAQGDTGAQGEATSHDDGNDVRGLARMQLWGMLISQTLRPAICAFARSREWAADRFALGATQSPQTGACALRRLRDQNLAEDEQPAWYEFFFATHPSLKARIAALESAPTPPAAAPG